MFIIWELPQFLLSLIMKRLFKKRIVREETYKGSKILRLKDTYWGVSLGKYIFLSENHKDMMTIKHEYGHSIQSRILGPLYLIIICLPSISMNIISTVLYRMGYPQFGFNYYNRWPETWADSLGDVDREVV